MTKVDWRGRFIAATIHLLATLFVTGLAAVLIFLVWFPDELATIAGGTKLFFIVVGCDVVLGPLLSLVIYNPAKGRGKLIFDYIVVGVTQLAALGYGVYIVSESRPAFIAFDLDRFEIVTAIELDADDLKLGADSEFRSLSYSGPRLVSVFHPTDVKEASDLATSAALGKDAYLMPKYYRSYQSFLPEIQSKSQPIDLLLKDAGTAGESIRAAIADSGRGSEGLRWLLLRHRFGFGTALIDAVTGEPLRYLAIDPEWVKN